MYVTPHSGQPISLWPWKIPACRRGSRLPLATAASLVHQLQEARDERRLLLLQQNFVAAKLLIVDELGYVPLPQTGAELLFGIFSQRHLPGSDDQALACYFDNDSRDPTISFMMRAASPKELSVCNCNARGPLDRKEDGLPKRR